MKNLIVGERYKVKHRQGNWEGEVTFDGHLPPDADDEDGQHRLKVRDIVVTGGEDVERATNYYRKKGFKTILYGTPKWWSFELLNFTLENE